MSGATLIAEAAQLGISIWAEAGAIRYRPKAAMPPALAASIKACRVELLKVLDPQQRESSPVANQKTKARPAHRLIDNGFPPIPTTIPPDSICTTPLPICPHCCSRPVLPELRTMTTGLCYTCWTAGS